MTNMRKWNYIVAVVIALLGGAVIAINAQYPIEFGAGDPGAGFWPTMLGGLLIVLAVVTIILLVRRKKAGCFCVYALYAVQVLANIVVLFAYLDFGMDVLSIILSILIGAVMLAVNVVYFGKRKHMFS